MTSPVNNNYWEQGYSEYWKNRLNTNDSNSPPSLDTLTSYLDTIPDLGFSTLDVGCGWGRLFDYFITKNITISGIDLSKDMISKAIKTYDSSPSIHSLCCSPSHCLPFEDNYFDSLVCIATFDCTDQLSSINEFLRVTKFGGHLFITGKNFHYKHDDANALAAEIGARAKGHPNYFTNFYKFKELLEASGHDILNCFYFLRRGDFAKRRHVLDHPSTFYEFAFTIRKGSHMMLKQLFSSSISLTYEESLQR